MAEFGISTLIKGAELSQDPLAEADLEDFLVDSDLDGSGKIDGDEWQGALLSDAALTLFGNGAEDEIVRENVFNKISQRFGTIEPSSVPALPEEPVFDEIADVDLGLVDASDEIESLAQLKQTTDFLIDEIINLNQGIDRNILAAIAEETAGLLTETQQLDDACALYDSLAILYTELGDPDMAHYSQARSYLFQGLFSEASTELALIPPDSIVSDSVSELNTVLMQMEAQHQHLESIRPSLIALEQMAMMSQEVSQHTQASLREHLFAGLADAYSDMVKKNEQTRSVVIRAATQALLDGRAQTLEEALAIADTNGLLKSMSAGPYACNGYDPEALAIIANTADEHTRNALLLDYTQGLIDEMPHNMIRDSAYPVRIIVTNLSGLAESDDPKISARAQEMLNLFLGKTGYTGLSDPELAGIIKGGMTEVPLMVGAMMVAGPAGALAEGSMALRMGRTGWIAYSTGFAVEGFMFWGAHDTLHATLIGGGEYFTAKGLLSSYLALGILRAAGGGWQASFGRRLARAAEIQPGRAALYGGMNATGAFVSELGGFTTLGYIEEGTGLKPETEHLFHTHLIEASIGLIQLKLAVAAGNHATNNALPIEILRTRLDLGEALLDKAIRSGETTKEQLIKLYMHIAQMRAQLAQLIEPQPALDGGPMMMVIGDKDLTGSNRTSNTTRGSGGGLDPRIQRALIQQEGRGIDARFLYMLSNLPLSPEQVVERLGYARHFENARNKLNSDGQAEFDILLRSPLSNTRILERSLILDRLAERKFEYIMDERLKITDAEMDRILQENMPNDWVLSLIDNLPKLLEMEKALVAGGMDLDVVYGLERKAANFDGFGQIANVALSTQANTRSVEEINTRLKAAGCPDKIVKNALGTGGSTPAEARLARLEAEWAHISGLVDLARKVGMPESEIKTLLETAKSLSDISRGLSKTLDDKCSAIQLLETSRAVETARMRRSLPQELQGLTEQGLRDWLNEKITSMAAREQWEANPGKFINTLNEHEVLSLVCLARNASPTAMKAFFENRFGFTIRDLDKANDIRKNILQNLGSFVDEKGRIPSAVIESYFGVGGHYPGAFVDKKSAYPMGYVYEFGLLAKHIRSGEDLSFLASNKAQVEYQGPASAADVVYSKGKYTVKTESRSGNYDPECEIPSQGKVLEIKSSFGTLGEWSGPEKQGATLRIMVQAAKYKAAIDAGKITKVQFDWITDNYSQALVDYLYTLFEPGQLEIRQYSREDLQFMGTLKPTQQITGMRQAG